MCLLCLGYHILVCIRFLYRIRTDHNTRKRTRLSGYVAYHDNSAARFDIQNRKSIAEIVQTVGIGSLRALL
jgi:hypothetical protein